MNTFANSLIYLEGSQVEPEPEPQTEVEPEPEPQKEKEKEKEKEEPELEILDSALESTLCFFIIKNTINIDAKYINFEILSKDIEKYLNSEVVYISDMYMNVKFNQDKLTTWWCDSISEFVKSHIERILYVIINKISPGTNLNLEVAQKLSIFMISAVMQKCFSKTMTY